MILIVVLIVSPLAGLGANVFLAKNYPRYTSAGFIQVQPQVQVSDAMKANVPVVDVANTALEIRTHAQILRHESLLTKVLQNPNSEIRKNKLFGVMKLSLGATGYGWSYLPDPSTPFTDSGQTSCH